MSGIRLAAVLIATSWILSAQPATLQAFEVASIKPSAANCSGPRPGSGPSPGRLELPCSPVRSLVRVAYGLLKGDQLAARRMEVLGGPAWLDTDKYDISAKAEGKASAATMLGPMMRTLLEDRFRLKVHVEAKESPVYALTVAKAGPKLTPTKEGSCVPLDLNNREFWGVGGPTPCGMPKMSVKDGMTILEISGTTMEEFAGRLPLGRDGRPVIDRTGLAGRYDIHLEFIRELPSGPLRINGVDQPSLPPTDNTGPSIFTALQEQLGLKLAPEKAPIDVLVIDSVQKPIEN